MTRNTRGIVTIDAISAMLALVAVALYFWPVRITVPPATTPASKVAPVAGAAAREVGDEVNTIVASNIMSASRRTPASRYVSPERGDAIDYTLPPAFQPSLDTTASTSDDTDAVPSLYGIVNTDGISRALLRLREADVSPVLLREGEGRGAYRVVSIRSNAVTVVGPGGQRILRLSKPVHADSIGKLQ